MARALSTVYQSSAGSTATANNKLTLISTAGHYVKTSGFDATGLILIIQRSTKSTGVGRVTIISGSTASKEDFEPGLYSTARNLDIKIATCTAASTKVHVIPITETARFKDTDGYIKIDFSTAMGGSGASFNTIFITK